MSKGFSSSAPTPAACAAASWSGSAVRMMTGSKGLDQWSRSRMRQPLSTGTQRPSSTRSMQGWVCKQTIASSVSKALITS